MQSAVPGTSSSGNSTIQEVQPPYCVPVTFNVKDEYGNILKKTVMAVVDSYLYLSPINMIRGSQIPIHARSSITERDGNYYGINNSRVNILGKIQDIVKVQDLVEPLCFFVVTENTMSDMALLGRDFTSRSHVRTSIKDKNLAFQRKLVNENNVGTNKNEDNIIKAVNEIMRIDYDKPCSMFDNLKINQEIDHGIYEV